jgi:PST family polysaccharide transporter
MALRRNGRKAARARSSLSERAGRALGVNLLNTLASRLGTFAIGVALARILGPEEFGTFAVALLALLAVLSFNELGVSLAIVRWPGPPREIAGTVTTIAVAASAVIFLVAVVVAPWFCDAMGAPQATDVVRVLSVSVLISGIVATPAAMLQREFRAGRRMVIDQVGNWAGALVSIATAVAGMGAMSLAVGRLAGALLSGVLFLRWSPISFGYDRAVVRRLLAFGLPLAGSSIIVFAVTFVDQFLVGAMLGPVALGFYVLAFNLSSWPVNVFSQPVRQVAPATFARLHDDVPARCRAFVLSAGLLAAVTVPVCLVLTGAAAPLVALLYGARWSPVAQALVWLGVLAALRILFELAYDYLVVIGSTKVVLAVQLIWLAALVPGVYVGARLAGIAGAAAGQVVVAVVVVLPIYLVYLRSVGIGARDLGARVAVPLACGAGVALVIFAGRQVSSLDVVELAFAAAALIGALGLQRRSIGAALHGLRSALSHDEGGGGDHPPRGAGVITTAAAPTSPVSVTT